MKPQFSLSGSLVNAVQFPDWRTVQLTLNVLDRSGVYTLVNASVGDIILIDASAYDVGLITSYLITDIVSRNVTTLIVTAVCELSEAPDLGWCIGSNVMITKNKYLLYELVDINTVKKAKYILQELGLINEEEDVFGGEEPGIVYY